jgi:hypothetical protein
MTTASQATTQVYRVHLRATPQAIWDAITEPEWTDRYGYGGEAQYDRAGPRRSRSRYVQLPAVQDAPG